MAVIRTQQQGREPPTFAVVDTSRVDRKPRERLLAGFWVATQLSALRSTSSTGRSRRPAVDAPPRHGRRWPRSPGGVPTSAPCRRKRNCS